MYAFLESDDPIQCNDPMCLAFAAAEDYETGQIDIKGAYLNGKLTEDEVIFMKQPPGYEEREEQVAG